MKMMTCHLLNFEEWLRADEARTYKAKPPKPHKHRPEPTVHHDLDTWLQHVDNLKKELELLKDKMGDKKAPLEKPKLLTYKPEDKDKDKDREQEPVPQEEPDEEEKPQEPRKPQEPEEPRKPQEPRKPEDSEVPKKPSRRKRPSVKQNSRVFDTGLK